MKQNWILFFFNMEKWNLDGIFFPKFEAKSVHDV